ncbi:DegT/DnrJ/EryC1/StrS family aminotransferase [Acidocella sp.]|uniref:DegT/DnrJ/EryC1/StrS family aminotransferase n=1 Tax=Acidocella sp. TaxID=50710 RepID=UPI003D0826B0
MSEMDPILLCDPDLSGAELAAAAQLLRSPYLSAGPEIASFEAEFANYVGRGYAVAVSSATLGLLCLLRAAEIGPGDEVICAPHGFREAAHAISLAGATPVFADIDYWSGTLAPGKAEEKLSPCTRAIMAGNANGHPAPWPALRALAAGRGVMLIEDSSEALGSRLNGQLIGTFGDASLFDFSLPSPLCCGEGAMVVTDDATLAASIRLQAGRRLEERGSVLATATAPFQATMSTLNAAIGRVQLRRLPELLERRKLTEAIYGVHMQSFEGIKPPYEAPDVTEMHWMFYLVHLGTRFSRSSRDAIIDDLGVAGIAAVAYSSPLHLQRLYFDRGYRRGDFLVTEKIAERAIALPFHAHLDADEIEFIVETMKDASVNVGAGAAIY